MKKLIRVKPHQQLVSLLFRLFADPWFAMLAFGAFGHRAHMPIFYRFDYWSVWLVNFGLQAIWPMDRNSEYEVIEKE